MNNNVYLYNRIYLDVGNGDEDLDLLVWKWIVVMIFLKSV